MGSSISEDASRLVSNREYSDSGLIEDLKSRGAFWGTTRSVTRNSRRFSNSIRLGNRFAVRQSTFRWQAGATDLI